jgi:hypothetical protein
MHITVKWFNDAFNINLHSKEGVDEFLSIKGCRIAQYEGKEFVSFPATKGNNGKFWRHAWGSDKFQAAVIAEAKKSMPSAGKRDGGVTEMADDVPFDNPHRGRKSYVV